MKPVNKIPYDGPTSYKSLLRYIAKDAEERYMPYVTTNIINSVIQHVFSEGGALNRIPHFITSNFIGFGRWVPDKKGIKLRKEYYIAKRKYRKAFRKIYISTKLKSETAKKQYAKYVNESEAEIIIPYYLWKRAHGITKKLNKGYGKLNILRKNFKKIEEKVYGYSTTKISKRKYRKYR